MSQVVSKMRKHEKIMRFHISRLPAQEASLHWTEFSGMYLYGIIHVVRRQSSPEK